MEADKGKQKRCCTELGPRDPKTILGVDEKRTLRSFAGYSLGHTLC